MSFYQKSNKHYQAFRQTHPVAFCLLCAAISGLLALILFFSLKKQYFFFYTVNDDMYLRDMMNGELYAGTGYTIMLKKWLGTLLTALYYWRPYTEWYALMMWGGILISLSAFFYTLLSNTKRLISLCLIPFSYLIFCLCFAEHFLVTTYTETAALLMLAAILTAHGAFLLREEQNCRLTFLMTLAASLFLALLSFSLRTDACLMMFPFAGILFLDCFLHASRSSKAWAFLYIFLLAGFFALIYFHDKHAYTISGYEQVLPYCAATNPLYNYYGVPDYLTNQEFYESIGMSYRTWDLFQSHNYVFAQDFNADQIAALSAYTVETAVGTSFGQWMENMSGSFLFMNFFPLGAVAAGTAILNFLFALLQHNRRIVLLQAGLLLAHLADASYLAYAGRLPDRVIVPLYLALLIFNLYLLQNLIASAWKTLSVCLLFFLTFLLCRDSVYTTIHDSQGLHLTLFNRQETVYQYIAENSDNFYLISPFINATGGSFTYDKTRRSSNYVYYADYTTYLPEWQQKLAEHNTDPAHLLDEFITNENLLLVVIRGELAEPIKEYLSENYPDRQLILVDTLCDCYEVYNVLGK